MKRFGIFCLLLALAIGAAWIATAPPDHMKIAPAYTFGPVSEAIRGVQTPGDWIAEHHEAVAPNLIGYDEVVLQEDKGRAFATGMDGWIWVIDLETGEAERFADVPLIAAGAHMVPTDDNRLCFCGMYLYGETYPEDERVGLYELDLTTKEITLLADRVPNPPAISAPREGNEGSVFVGDAMSELARGDMTEANSRPLAFCNDFAVSSDGQRYYISEPFPYEGASMGGGAFGEAITLGRNGRLWRLDRERDTVALIAQDYNFIDGVLTESSPGARETSVLVTETTKFRMLRLYLEGEKAGQDEIVWDSLPSMPDGLHRDHEGNIWIGLIKLRSPFITSVHAKPWVKPLLLRLPLAALPVDVTTAVMALSPDASKPLFYTEHAGTHVTDISAATPGKEHVYLANFAKQTPGLHRVPNPLRDATR